MSVGTPAYNLNRTEKKKNLSFDDKIISELFNRVYGKQCKKVFVQGKIK